MSVNFTRQLIPSQGNRWHPSNGSVGGVQSRYERSEEENPLSLLGVNPQIFHPTALLLHRIHYPVIYTCHRVQYANEQIYSRSLTEVKNLTVFQTSFQFLSYQWYALT